MRHTIRVHRLFCYMVFASVLFVASPGFALVDMDGDGVDDSIDNCRTYPNPAQDGVARIKANGPLVAGGATNSFQVSRNGQWVVYTADQDTDNANELYRVCIP